MSEIDKIYSMMWPEEAKAEEEILLPPVDDFFEVVETRDGEVKRGRFIAPKLARWIMEKNRIKTTSLRGSVYVYRDGVYHSDGEEYIHGICSKVLGDDFTSKRYSEVVSFIKAQTYATRDETPSPNLVCCKNGILDLFSGVLMPHNPDLFLTAQIPVEYAPGVDCPAIKEFFAQIVSQDDIFVLQEIAGWLLYGIYEPQKAAMFIGEGCNGKSTFIGLLRAFIGADNISSIDLQTLATNDFARSRLCNRMANLYADLPDVALKQTGNFKMLTGGDSLYADLKFKDGIDFVNRAKLVFSCNKLPDAHDETDAFYRRWVFVQFPNKFEGEARNPNKLKDITTPLELTGLLNWSMLGLCRLLARKDFSNGKATEDIRDYYQRMASPVVAFAKDELFLDSKGFVNKNTIYAVFCDYCHKNKLPTTSKDVFSRGLLEYYGSSIQSSQYRENGKRVHGWLGLSIGSPAQPAQPTQGFSLTKLILENNEKKVLEEKNAVPVVPVVPEDGMNCKDIVSELRLKHNFDQFMPDDTVLEESKKNGWVFEVSPGKWRLV